MPTQTVETLVEGGRATYNLRGYLQIMSMNGQLEGKLIFEGDQFTGTIFDVRNLVQKDHRVKGQISRQTGEINLAMLLIKRDYKSGYFIEVKKDDTKGIEGIYQGEARGVDDLDFDNVLLENREEIQTHMKGWYSCGITLSSSPNST